MSRLHLAIACALTIASAGPAWAEPSVAGARWSLDAARAGLKAAVERVDRDAPSKEDLDAAVAAVAALERAIDDGAAVEPRDLEYAKVALDARRELRAKRQRVEQRRAKLQLDERRRETAAAVEKQTLMGDLTRAALAKAVAVLREPEVTDLQLESAERAATDLAALLDKGKALERADTGYRAYAGKSRAELGQARAQIDATWKAVGLARLKAQLEPVRADLVQAARALGKARPTADELAEARTAAIVVHKLLEQVPASARKTAGAYLGEVARALHEVEVALQRSAMDGAVAEMRRAVKRLEGRLPSEERVTAATVAVLALDQALQGVKRELASHAALLRTESAVAKRAIAKRKLEVEVEKQRAEVERAFLAARASLGAARRPEARDAEVSAAAEGGRAARAVLERKLDLEKQDRGYAGVAARARETLEKLDAGVELARKAVAFRSATAAVLASGDAAAEEARGARDIRTRLQRYEKAVNEYKSCQRAGERMLDESPELGSIAVVFAGRRGGPKGVVAACAAHLASAQKEMKGVAVVVAFEDGPKAHFEKGHQLLRQGKRLEAIEDFDECVSSGKFLHYKNPDLGDRRFEVVGAPMTVVEVVEACASEAQHLRASTHASR